MLSDSNILIYAGVPGVVRFDPYFLHPDACISEVTRVEVLGFPGFRALDPFRQSRLEGIIELLAVLPLDTTIGDRAIELRRLRKMGLGDSIIAATALAYDVPLVTRNVNDFRLIPDLRIINPFDLFMP